MHPSTQPHKDRSALSVPFVVARELRQHAAFQSTWGEAENAMLDVIGELFDDAAPARIHARGVRATELYQTVYDGATQGQPVANKLYHKLREWLDELLSDKVTKPLVELRDSGDDEKLLSMVVQLAMRFREFMRFVKHAFMYLDAHLVKRRHYDTIETMFNKAFVRAVNKSVKGALGSAIRAQVNAHCDNNRVDLTALNAAVGIFVDVDTATHPGKKRPIPVGIKEVVTHPERGWAALLDRWDVSGLARMHQLVVCLPPRLARTILHQMGKAMQRRLEAEHSELIKDFKGTATSDDLPLEAPLVTATVELDDKYVRLIQDHFDGNDIFEGYREKAFAAADMARYVE